MFPLSDRGCENETSIKETAWWRKFKRGRRTLALTRLPAAWCSLLASSAKRGGRTVLEESQLSLTHLLAAALTRKKKLQSGDVRATRKTDRNRGRRADWREGGRSRECGGMWEETGRRTKQSRWRADSCNVLKCAPARHTAVPNWGCAADLRVLTSLLHPPAAPSQLCCLLMSQTLESRAKTKTKRLSRVCASLDGLKNHTGSRRKWGTKAEDAKNMQGRGTEGARLSC